MKKYLTFFKHHKDTLLLSSLIAIILGPLLYYRLPWYVSAPDIFYVKAKVLQVLAGSLFTDPITGYVTFHPPYYHLFLSFLSLLGIEIDWALIIVTVLNVSLIFFFAFKMLEVTFDRKTAFFTCLLIPFIVEYMGCRNILLATSFYFSMPFYLAGLWLYLKSNEFLLLTTGSAVLWGLAFLISPV